jgi:hypothetical protein
MTRRFRPGGPIRRKGYLLNAQLLTIFGAIVIKGTLLNNGELSTIIAVVRCLDGRSDEKTRVVWTDKGRFKVSQRSITNQLLGG